MNDEIKEILDYLKNNSYTFDEVYIEDYCKIITKEENEKLLDYITNLQQINKNLTNSLNKKVEEVIKLQLKNDKLQEQCKQWKENHKAICIQRDNILNNTIKDIEEQIDYKSRNKKAIEEIELYRNRYTGNLDRRFKGILDKLQGIDKE